MKVKLKDLIINQKLGEGGIASVYLVTHQKSQKQFALKTLLPKFAKDELVRKRFLTEAGILLSLKHPNIVRCYDVFKENNQIFLLLEYVPGVNIAQLIEKLGEPLSLALIFSYFKQILNAVQYLHEKGIVHRDIKPQNIFLYDTGLGFSENSLVKLGDLGIAKALGLSNLTRSDICLGTYSFMSPEQIKKPADIDHRSDIYSLGATFYYMCTANLPYPQCNSISEFVEAITTGKIVSIDIYNRHIPVWLKEIILKMMAKNPDMRFCTCNAVLHELEKNQFRKGRQLQNPGCLLNILYYLAILFLFLVFSILGFIFN